MCGGNPLGGENAYLKGRDGIFMISETDAWRYDKGSRLLTIIGIGQIEMV